MKASQTGTARFAKVVETAGKPQIVSLWTKPERDKHFMAAVRQNRVMTIKQETVGSAQDFGTVGFIREKNVSYLIFPSSLDGFEGHRIVGVKYDLVETPKPVGRVIKPEAMPRAAGKGKLRPAEWKPEPQRVAEGIADAHGKRTFTVTIQFSATAHVRETVDARSKKEAKELGLQQAVMPDLGRGTVTRKVVKVAQD
jgi:hypothetical protein